MAELMFLSPFDEIRMYQNVIDAFRQIKVM